MTEPPAASPERRAWRHAPAVILFLVVTGLLLTADLVTKSMAFERVADVPVSLERDADGQLPPIPGHAAIIVVPKVLALHLTANEGAVFGLGRGARWLLVGFSVIAVGVVGTVFVRSSASSLLLHLTLASVLAGALGNLYDRVVFGVVRDMCWLFPGVKLPFGWRWPDGSDGLYPWIFNVADVCLVVSLFVLMIIMYRHDRAIARERAASS